MQRYEAINFLENPFAQGHDLHDLENMSASSHIDPFDQHSMYDSEPYMSGDEISYNHSVLAHRAMMKRISSGFEDPFAHATLAQFEQGPDTPADSPSVDSESKYLSFAPSSSSLQLYDASLQPCCVDIQAQLHGMFFLAESQWPGSIDGVMPPPELTCYRRNLFQITGSVKIPQNLRYVLTEAGRRVPIHELEIAVNATESVEGHPVKLISVPWKTPSGLESPKLEEKVEKEPAAITLDMTLGTDMALDVSTIAFQWKRMQFRIATANNGRRKELQQHFNLHLQVFANVSTGGKICIAQSQSSAIIVRGRSPRNFAARKDIPLGGSSTCRKHIPSLTRNHESSHSVSSITAAPNRGSPQREEAPRSQSFLESSNTMKPEIDLNGWQQYSGHATPEDGATVAFTGSPVPSSQPAFNFHFAPHELISTKGAPPIVHYDSGDEATSAYITQRISRRSSRPPTSNPSPEILGEARKCYAGMPNLASFSEEPPMKIRARIHSHNASLQRASLTSPPSQTTRLSMNTGFERSNLLQKMSSIASSPLSNTDSEPVSEYLPGACLANEWQLMNHGFRQQQAQMYQCAVSENSFSPPGKNKRYYSEVNV